MQSDTVLPFTRNSFYHSMPLSYSTQQQSQTEDKSSNSKDFCFKKSNADMNNTQTTHRSYKALLTPNLGEENKYNLLIDVSDDDVTDDDDNSDDGIEIEDDSDDMYDVDLEPFKDFIDRRTFLAPTSEPGCTKLLFETNFKNQKYLSSPSDEDTQPLNSCFLTEEYQKSNQHKNFLEFLVSNEKIGGKILKCTGCKKAILDRFVHKVQENPWHAECLRCGLCGVYLSSSCFARDNALYCKDDFMREFASKCSACDQQVSSTEMVRRANSNVYHVECFRCCRCNTQMTTGDEFYLVENSRIVCKKDYEEEKFSAADGDESNQKRPRTKIKPEQLKLLKRAFNQTSKPSAHTREQLSNETGLDRRVIQVWFQNRRAKEKRSKKEIVELQESGCSNSIRNAITIPTETDIPTFSHRQCSNNLSREKHFDLSLSPHKDLNPPLRIFDSDQTDSSLSFPSLMSNSGQSSVALSSKNQLKTFYHFHNIQSTSNYKTNTLTTNFNPNPHDPHLFIEKYPKNIATTRFNETSPASCCSEMNRNTTSFNQETSYQLQKFALRTSQYQESESLFHFDNNSNNVTLYPKIKEKKISNNASVKDLIFEDSRFSYNAETSFVDAKYGRKPYINFESNTCF